MPPLGGLGAALLLGLLVRVGPILAADFPLGDGALFASAAEGIRAHGFLLPESIAYNGADIPFLYPPLGLYLLAAVPGDVVQAERWLPLLWSLLAVVGAWLLLRELAGPLIAGVGALFFAAMPLAWAIEGGGVTRALGHALLYLALWRLAVMLRFPGWRNAVLAGALAGLAVLAHPAVGPTGLASAGLLVLWRPSRRGGLMAVAALVVAALVVTPWLATVAGRHGLDALVAGYTSHDEESQLLRVLVFGPTWLGTFDPTVGLAVAGIVVVLARRAWLFPAWLALLILVVPGGGGRYATLVWAALAAHAAVALLPALSPRAARYAGAGMAVVLLLLGITAGYQRFSAIPGHVREAMAEVAATMPAEARFAVRVASSADEPIIEWFPFLSGRVSLGTYMGSEWRGDAPWREARRLNAEIQAGEAPPEADYLFDGRGGSVTITEREPD